MKILLKHLFIIVLFIVLFLGIGEFLRYILIDDTHSFTRIKASSNVFPNAKLMNSYLI